MGKLLGLRMVVMALLLAGAGAQSQEGANNVSDKVDASGRIRIGYYPKAFAGKQLTDLKKIESSLSQWLLSQNSKLTAENFELRNVRESLTAKHFYFQQKQDGLVVESAEVIVSVDNSTQEMYRIFDNSTESKPAVAKAGSQLTSEKAVDIAWKHIWVSGRLLADVKSEKLFIEQDGTLRLTYRVEIDTVEPAGSWEVILDAYTGEIVRTQDLRKDAKHDDSKPVFGRTPGKKLLDYREAVKALDAKKSISLLSNGNRRDATALVFDPDPRTTLTDNTLLDSSPKSAFEPAYKSVVLKDVTEVAGVLKLSGPWVTLVDFEAPVNTPYTVQNGEFKGKRGDQSFNDAMTYYHLDKNQRYMQSLGFFGSRGIQYLSITVDSNGANGADNSYYRPSANHLAFGWGCVDDNEDADVILHEYNHAINHSINSNFSGGDTGAMGEGFGDYWAQSYSISTENGMTFNPFHVFNWDAHSDPNNEEGCWPGRRLDKTQAQYVHSQNYYAHSRHDSFVSDELWSTPIFQALYEAVKTKQATREEMDRIILEAQFGLGYGLKMRDMANSIVSNAKRLYPQGKHAEIYARKFAAQNIIERQSSLVPLAKAN